MDVKEAIETYKNIKEFKSVYASIDADFFLNFAETVLSELEKKDRIINLMSKELYVEGYCKKIDCKRCTANKFEDCIKEDFTKKVEGK